jgi:hypothetical protein
MLAVGCATFGARGRTATITVPRVQPADVDDLTQEVLSTVVRELPGFYHDLGPGASRRW